MVNLISDLWTFGETVDYYCLTIMKVLNYNAIYIIQCVRGKTNSIVQVIVVHLMK